MAMALRFRRVDVIIRNPAVLKDQAYHVFISLEQMKRVYGESPVGFPVSFSREIVIAVHRGLCPTGGYGIHIESIDLTGSNLIVRLIHTDPRMHYVTLMPTYPKDLIAVSRSCIGRPGRYKALFQHAGNEVAAVPFEI